MTAFYFSHSHTFMKHMYQHISTHKTHMYAMLTSCLLCICNFFHLFFLPPSCFSLSLSLSVLRLDAGKLWIVFYFCAATSLTLFFALSLNATCPVTWFIHSDRHGAGECCLSLSPHFNLPLPPSHFSPGSILRQELETQSCADVYQPIPGPAFYLRVYQSP